jgi:hypothetical protein
MDLVANPRPARAFFQAQWAPLNEAFSFFLQYADGTVAIQELDMRDS